MCDLENGEHCFQRDEQRQEELVAARLKVLVGTLAEIDCFFHGLAGRLLNRPLRRKGVFFRLVNRAMRKLRARFHLKKKDRARKCGGTEGVA